jgi:aryl-alcohol dehydrogenase-like predicted oxidoreductase
VNKLALGTVQFGLDYGINNQRGIIPENEVFEILEFAYDNGIDTLDTAYLYGKSEEVLGKFFSQYHIDFKVISKLPDCSASEVRNIVDTSLKRLNRNKLYGYLIHNFKFFKQDIQLFKSLREVKTTRKIKKIGFSLYYPGEVEFLFELGIIPDIVQIPYSVFDQRFNSVLSLLKEHNVEVHCRSVFLQGLVFKGASELESKFNKIFDKLNTLHDIAQKSSLPVSILCLNFAVLNPFLDKVVIGVDSIENIKENINALSYTKKVSDVYDDLLALREDDEKIILPFNW